jgi:hypothetical protein
MGSGRDNPRQVLSPGACVYVCVCAELQVFAHGCLHMFAKPGLQLGIAAGGLNQTDSSVLSPPNAHSCAVNLDVLVSSAVSVAAGAPLPRLVEHIGVGHKGVGPARQQVPADGVIAAQVVHTRSILALQHTHTHTGAQHSAAQHNTAQHRKE